MLVLVSYDVSTQSVEGKKRLRHIAKLCKDFGIRVQNSVFECNVNPVQWLELKKELESICDKEFDSLRYYYLGKKYQTKIEHFGAKNTIDVEDPIVI